MIDRALLTCAHSSQQPLMMRMRLSADKIWIHTSYTFVPCHQSNGIKDELYQKVSPENINKNDIDD